MAIDKIGGVPASFLTHKFVFGEKECLVGKFDPDYPTESLAELPLEKLGTELMEQIARSGVFTQNELENIAMLDSESFLNNFIEM